MKKIVTAASLIISLWATIGCFHLQAMQTKEEQAMESQYRQIQGLSGRPTTQEKLISQWNFSVPYQEYKRRKEGEAPSQPTSQRTRTSKSTPSPKPPVSKTTSSAKQAAVSKTTSSAKQAAVDVDAQLREVAPQLDEVRKAVRAVVQAANEQSPALAERIRKEITNAMK